MSDRLFGPRGQLQDFVPLPGDPTPEEQRKQGGHGSRQRWGNTILLSNRTDLVQPARTSATVVDTGDLHEAKPINIQMRFAVAQQQGAGGGKFTLIAKLPFRPVFPGLGLAPGTFLRVRVRRGTDPNAGVVVDEYRSLQTSTNDTFGVDTITARSLGIELELVAPAGQLATVYVETIATIVGREAQRNRLPGYPAIVNAVNFVAASNVPLAILNPHADRAQFIICNTSTNANMIVAFDPPTDTPAPVAPGPIYPVSAAAGPPPSGTLVLPANQFATYESPIGGWRGQVSAVWDNGAPNGGALVTEGAYFGPTGD
jgi:hypothetical protein